MQLATAIALSQLTGGGPGSGRHAEFSKLPPKGKMLLSWVDHPEHGIVFDTHSDRREHSSWFRAMGLPSSGKGFDNIERGIVEISPRLKRTTIVSYQEEAAPPELENVIRSSRSETSGHNFEDKSLGLRPSDVAAGGPGSGCRGPNCGRHPKIEKSTFPLNAKQHEVERAFRKQLLRNPEHWKDVYKQRFGNVLNADNAKELSPHYAKDRTGNNLAVHEGASWLIKQIYKDALAKQAPPGIENNIVFTAGGAGVGKTTAIENSAEGRAILHNSQLVYDGTLRPAASAISKIDQALAAGKGAIVYYVHRNAEDAFENGVLPRAARMEREKGSGRSVPLDEFISQHTSIHDSMKQVAERYKDNPKFTMLVVDNSHGQGNAKVSTLDLIPKETRTPDQLRSVLSAKLDKAYADGKISTKIYEATRSKGTAKEVGV